eukprot:scpid19663/ scgid14733/ Regulator of telomere elongation helicase 1
MVMFEVRGVQVDFPFEPYPCQKVYMEKVITCLQERRHGLLESPTGTGKTLCLLCATLAWRNHTLVERSAMLQSSAATANSAKPEQGGFYGSAPSNSWTKGENVEAVAPRIIYASRTHSQLSQVIGELKSTVYQPKVCILGSRDQLCVNPTVLRAETLTEKVHMCRAKVSSRSCSYYNAVEDKKKDPTLTETIMDIEDLVTLGSQQRVCPYYLARELRSTADIIFMPYNYILDAKTRHAFGVDLNNTIVILDEAHNVERMCEESSSFDLTSTDVAASISNVTRCVEYVSTMKEGMPMDVGLLPSNDEPGDDDEKDYIALKHILINVETELDKLDVPPDGVTKKGGFIFDFFEACGITSITKGAILETCDKALSVLTTQATFMGKNFALQKFVDAIRTVFGTAAEDTLVGHTQSNTIRDLSHFYKVHIANDKKAPKAKTGLWSSGNASRQGRVLSYWCFSPGRAMCEMVRHGIHSLIMTSGTLSPLESFSSEMHVQFDVQLQNPHVIDGGQIFVGVLSTGPGGKCLRSSFDRRSVPEYKTDLGNALVNIARVVPNGMLVFFPSYPVMAECIEHWKENYNIWERINKLKPAFTEPKNKADFNMTMDGFYSKIHDVEYHAAAFFAVCRGKVSEGLDFADYNGRAVVITGLPFPPRFDPRVKLKMEYMEECCRKHKRGEPDPISGEKWYRQQASRAVNQAIGRVIRHRKDFGAILLCDERFAKADVQGQLPRWVRPHTRMFNVFSHLARELPKFFSGAERLVGAPPLPSGPGKHQRQSAAASEVTAKSILARPLAGNKTRVPLMASNQKEYFVDSLATAEKRRHVQIEYDRFDEKQTSGGACSTLPAAACGNSALASLSTAPQPTLTAADSAIGSGKNPINVYEAGAKMKKIPSISERFLSQGGTEKKSRPTIRVVPSRRVTTAQSDEIPSTSSATTASVLSTSSANDTERHGPPAAAAPSAAAAAARPDSSSEPDGAARKQKLAHSYLGRVREALKHDAKAYPALLSSLQRYKKEKDLDALWKVISATFSSPSQYDLLTEFTTFLRAEHTDEYKQRCEDFHNGSRRSVVASGRAGAGAGLSSSSKSSTTHSTSEKNCKGGDPASKSSSAATATAAASHGSVITAAGPGSATLTYELDSNGAQVGVIQLPDNELFRKLPKQSHLPSGRVCVKCKKKPNLFEAPCTHACCIACWKAQFKVERKCPECDQPVRSKNLKKVYFL